MNDLTLKLESILLAWKKLLTQWAIDGSFSAAAVEALQLNGEPEGLQEIVEQLTAGDYISG